MRLTALLFDPPTRAPYQIQEDNVSPIQTNTPMEVDSVNIGEHNIVQGGLTFMQDC